MGHPETPYETVVSENRELKREVQRLTTLSKQLEFQLRQRAISDVVAISNVVVESAKHASHLFSDKAKSRPFNQLDVMNYMTFKGVTESEAARQSEAFWDHFSSNGWKVGGKAPMKDWQAAVRTWIRNLKIKQEDKRVFGKATVSDITSVQQQLKMQDDADTTGKEVM